MVSNDRVTKRIVANAIGAELRFAPAEMNKSLTDQGAFCGGHRGHIRRETWTRTSGTPGTPTTKVRNRFDPGRIKIEWLA